jgi:hypothetical protein
MAVEDFGNMQIPTYKGANVSFVKRVVRQTQNQVYCGCIQPQYKQIKTAENDPHVSNAMRISQILSYTSSLGGKINFGNVNSNSKQKYNAFSAQSVVAIKPIRNKF